MKIDRKFYEQFEEKVKSDEIIRELYEKGDVRAVEEYVHSNILLEKSAKMIFSLPSKWLNSP